MKYFTFLPEFHNPIRQRVKRSTIRGKAKVTIGERFALRYWTARPYGSPMGFLGTAHCHGVWPIGIALDRFLVPCHCNHPLWLIRMSNDAFAHMEGFADWAALRKHFIRKHRIDQKPLEDVILTYWSEAFVEGAP